MNCELQTRFMSRRWGELFGFYKHTISKFSSWLSIPSFRAIILCIYLTLTQVISSTFQQSCECSFLKDRRYLPKQILKFVEMLTDSTNQSKPQGVRGGTLQSNWKYLLKLRCKYSLLLKNFFGITYFTVWVLTTKTVMFVVTKLLQPQINRVRFKIKWFKLILKLLTWVIFACNLHYDSLNLRLIKFDKQSK